MKQYHPKQKAVWLDLMKFEPTPEHLAAWTRKMEKAVKYQEYIASLNQDKLMPIWQQARKHPTKTVEMKVADPVLKSVWREHMEFTPTALHLSLLQKQIEKDLDIDGYWKKVTVDTLLEVAREVALTPAVAPVAGAAAQPNLNLAEAK